MDSQLLADLPRHYEGRRLLKPKQAQAVLNIGNTTFYQLVAERKLDILKIGRASFVDARSIDEFVDGLRAAAKSE
jgi:hypothetical protein